jgi:hypothetical protein
LQLAFRPLLVAAVGAQESGQHRPHDGVARPVACGLGAGAACGTSCGRRRLVWRHCAGSQSCGAAPLSRSQTPRAPRPRSTSVDQRVAPLGAPHEPRDEGVLKVSPLHARPAVESGGGGGAARLSEGGRAARQVATSRALRRPRGGGRFHATARAQLTAC